jgi:hypothetical protein
MVAGRPDLVNDDEVKFARPLRKTPLPPSSDYLRQRFAFSISLSEKPFDRAQDSTAASPYWTTAFFTIQQGTACAGNETNAMASKQMRVIYRA